MNCLYIFEITSLAVAYFAIIFSHSEGCLFTLLIVPFKPFQYSCLENPINSMKRQNDRILKEELPRSVGAQYAEISGEITPEKNEGMEPKQKEYPAVDVTGDRSKVRCCKEQYCTGTWNVRFMNQGKLEEVKQQMARVNIDILVISELRWTEMGEFN